MKRRPPRSTLFPYTTLLPIWPHRLAPDGDGHRPGHAQRATADRTPAELGMCLVHAQTAVVRGAVLSERYAVLVLCSLPGGNIGRCRRTGGVSQSGGSLVGGLAPSPVIDRKS